MNEARYPFHPRIGEQLERRTGIRRDGREHIPYHYSDDIIVAVNAALATRRPLLLRGAPGCGKSTLARDVALALDRDFDEKVITSRTTATDLLWEFDAIARLSDTGPDPAAARNRNGYVRRGLLWNAFAPSGGATRGAVVLIDEIDKADPDVPNDLLVPLGEDRFTVTDTDPHTEVRRTRDVLVLITSNGERELPPAFLRRCIALALSDPSENPAALASIAQCHIAAMYRDEGKPVPALDGVLLAAIVKRLGELNTSAAMRKPGTAEILDAFKASLQLAIAPASDDWATLTRVLLFKEPGNPDAPTPAKP
jgi:MoxR-like ATPase